MPALSRRDLPLGLLDLLRAMTTKDPAARPTAAAVSTRASDIAAQAGLPLTSAMPAQPRPQGAVPTMLPPVGPSISGPPPPDPGLSGRPSTARAGTTSGRVELDAPTNALRREPEDPPPPPRRRRWGRILAGIGVLVVLSMVGGGILTWKLLPAWQPATGTASTPAAPTSSAAPAPTAAQPRRRRPRCRQASRRSTSRRSSR